MYITIELPAGTRYVGTRSWYIDPEDGWVVEHLNADVSHATRRNLVADGLDPSALVVDALSDGAVVTFVEVS